MKAVFVNGTLHGQCLEIAKPERWLFCRETSKGCELHPDVATYSCNSDRQSQLEVSRLENLLRQHGAIIGLNIWLDEILESRLNDNTALRQQLFSARTAFEFVIATISRRATSARLRRRFPSFF